MARNSFFMMALLRAEEEGDMILGIHEGEAT